jgi:hypothetical protein
LDALINHALGVQVLQRNLIERNIPARALAQAELLGWDAGVEAEPV